MNVSVVKFQLSKWPVKNLYKNQTSWYFEKWHFSIISIQHHSFLCCSGYLKMHISSISMPSCKSIWLHSLKLSASETYTLFLTPFCTTSCLLMIFISWHLRVDCPATNKSLGRVRHYVLYYRKQIHILEKDHFVQSTCTCRKSLTLSWIGQLLPAFVIRWEIVLIPGVHRYIIRRPIQYTARHSIQH